jgi:hypothetical protein
MDDGPHSQTIGERSGTVIDFSLKWLSCLDFKRQGPKGGFKGHIALH